MLALHDLQSSFRRYLAGGPPDGLLQTVDGVGFAPEARMAIRGGRPNSDRPISGISA
jgi:hypothetical protein